MDSYEMRELAMFRKQMEEVEKLPLAERKENAMEWFKDLSDNYMMVAERVGWLLNGSYGKGSFDSACRVVNSPRMNQVAWCAITIANLEWRCPAKMAIMAWKKLPVETRYQVNEAIRREIADAKAEGYCGEIKKNPGTSDGFQHKLSRVYVGKLYPKIVLTIDGDYMGTTQQFPSLKSALENLKEDFPMRKGKYLVASYLYRPGSRKIKLTY
jgi:hypothetical protein